MFTVIEEHEMPVNHLSIDVELIGDSIHAALGMDLSTSTRRAIAIKIQILIGHLNLLLHEGLGADGDQPVKTMLAGAYRHLDLQCRPCADTPAFSAYTYMRETALLTRHFLALYIQRNGTGVA